MNSFPKVELHVHLDGSVDVKTASEILNEDYKYLQYQMSLKSNCENLNEYLTKFDIPVKIMNSKKNLERIAYELTVNLKNDGVIYAEVRFAPLKHVTPDMNMYEVVESVIMGLNRLGLKTNLILCMMRGTELKENQKVIDLAHHYLNKGVCAVDLAGAESLYKTSDYKDLFLYAKEKEVPFTIHAGEADGPDSIAAAISFGAKRIGHGIRIIESNELIEVVKEKDILLEICPTSNIQTKVVSKIKNHPIKDLYLKGVKVSINTDNRTVSNTTLTREYILLRDNLGFTTKDFIEMNKEAIKHSFLSEEEKEKLLKKFNSLL
ncbi:MAG: adenosine deaminase [Bacilli bacterium]